MSIHTIYARNNCPGIFEGNVQIRKFGDSADLHPAAVHEAAHAVMADELGEEVEVVQVHDDGGGCTVLRRSGTEIIARHRAMISLAGQTAERLFEAGGSTSHWDRWAFDRAWAALTPAERESVPREVERLLLKRRDDVHRIAKLLTERGTIHPKGRH